MCGGGGVCDWTSGQHINSIINVTFQVQLHADQAEYWTTCASRSEYVHIQIGMLPSIRAIYY